MKRHLESIILTRQELQIMKVVWERDAATVKEVCEVMSRKKPTAYTTVLTLMGILEQKGALNHVRVGRAYLYKPVLSREQAVKNQIRDLITRFFDGKVENLIESVLRHEVADEQLDSVRMLIEQRQQN